VNWDVAPDGSTLVYASNPDKDEALSTNSDLWVTPLAGGGTPKNLNRVQPGVRRFAPFSPDGKWIAYRAQKRRVSSRSVSPDAALDRASGQARGLTEGFRLLGGRLPLGPGLESILFASQVRGRETLYRIGLAGGAPAALWTGGSVAGMAIAGGRVFFGATSLSRAPELWSVGADGNTPAALTHVNDALFRELALGEVSERFTDSSDRRKLQAWVVKPPSFDP